MKINIVIVEDNLERGHKAGRYMASVMRQQMVGWEMHVHIRKSDNISGKDDGYAEFRP